MAPPDELRRVVASLQAALRKENLTQREVSVRLGQHPNYLTQVFAGKARLREEIVVSVLALAGIKIHDFYAELERERPVVSEPEPRSGPVSAEDARRFIREALSARDGARRKGGAAFAEPSAARHCERVRELLRLKIRQEGLHQRDISRSLGEHPDYLSQVLRGNVALKTAFVLALIRTLGSTPAAFYAELAGVRAAARTVPAASREVARGVTWGEILALIDEELESNLTGSKAANAAPKPGVERMAVPRRSLKAS